MERRVVRYRHNVLKIHSLDAFTGVKGAVNQDTRDVYFVRGLTSGHDCAGALEDMDAVLQKAMQEGKLLYRKIEKLPFLAKQEEINAYASCYAKWVENHGKRADTKVTEAIDGLAEALGAACSRVLELYLSSRPGSSESMRKNFTVKMLYWFDTVMGGHFLTQWNEKCVIKIVAENVVKEQEYLFFYMLTLIGADVLLIQSADFACREDLQALSEEFVLERNRAAQPVNAAPPLRQSPGRSQAPKIAKEDTKKKAEQKTNQSTNQGINQKTMQRREKTFEELALIAASVVMIEVHNQTGDIISTGSGIMIGKGGYILTNNHVASGGRFYSVRIEDDARIYETDEVIKYNPMLDLAIIRIERELMPIPVYKGKEPLVRGQKVVAIGSPLGLFNSVSDGIISGFRRIGDVDMIQFTAPISHGSSGGAVLNMFGEVIGISTAGMDSGQNLNLAVGYEWINMFVKGFE